MVAKVVAAAAMNAVVTALAVLLAAVVMVEMALARVTVKAIVTTPVVGEEKAQEACLAAAEARTFQMSDCHSEYLPRRR